MTWNKRHKLLRRVFSTVMALVLAVSLLPTYAFAASVPTSTTIDGNTTDFTGAWKSAHYKPGTYTVTANLAMPGQYNPILTGVTIRKVPGKTGIDLDNTTIEVIKPDLEPYGYTLDMNEQLKVISIGNLGLLYIVTTDPTIQSIQNLAGRTVYSIGEGGPPEYTFEYMLEQYHLIGQVNFSLRSTPFEVLNLSTGAESVTTVTVVRKAFREQHEQAVQEYLQLAKQSTDYTLANVEQAIVHHHWGGDEAEALGLPADHV